MFGKKSKLYRRIYDIDGNLYLIRCEATKSFGLNSRGEKGTAMAAEGMAYTPVEFIADGNF